ncbi:hypothetical protein ACW4TU_45460 (plasmid) [Streptomyces sp. QTS52]
MKEVSPLEADKFKLPATLKEGDFLNFSLTATSSMHTCTWIPVVDWVSKGEEHSTEVKGVGTPFRTTPSKGLKEVVLVPSEEEDGWIYARELPATP